MLWWISLSKPKRSYACSECGTASSQWAGQCTDCGAWNSLTEVVATKAKANNLRNRYGGYTGEFSASVVAFDEVPLAKEVRLSTGLSELDRALGGGLVAGSVVLIGGDPGIGKSTLLLQSLSKISEQAETLYVTGEESLQQVKLRAERLGIKKTSMLLLAETQVEVILTIAGQGKPKILVIDSIQTLYSEAMQSAPGSVGQVRESAAQLVRFAKQTGAALFLVGHVTKEGMLAGPRVLEHMVDTVLYFEGESDGRYRLVRAVKNRFGAINELGIFAMTDKGLAGINNPSAIFLSKSETTPPGSVVMVTREGSRPLLVEIQALVDESHLANPRRVVVGLDQSRLALILAVLHRHGGVVTFNQDVFVNVVGGVRVTETGIDLPALLAVLSSLKNRALPNDLVVFGEVGLAGEIRPVQNGQERLKEAAKLGFEQAIVPKANLPKNAIDGMSIRAVSCVQDAIALL